MKIDSHQHFWKYDPEIYSWIPDSMKRIRKDFTPEDLWPILEENGMDGCISVQADQSEEETVSLLELGNSHKFVKGVVGWVDLNAPDVQERLELYARDPLFKGVRHTVWDKRGEFMEDLDFQRGIAALAAFGLTYDILVFDYQLPGAVELVRKFPEQKFVLDHMAKPQITGGTNTDWEEQIRLLGSSSGVYCKISGLLTQTDNFDWKIEDFFPLLQVVKESFGVERLLFGSDWPVCLTAGEYPDTLRIIEEFFTREEQEKIFGQNAAKCYMLEQTSKRSSILK